MNNLVNQLITDDMIWNYSNKDPMEIMNTMALIGNAKKSFPYLDEVLLYIKNDNMLVSSSSTYRLNDFINHVYLYDNWNDTEFIDTLNNSDKSFFKPVTEVYFGNIRKNYLTYVFNIPVYSDRVILLIINMDFLNETSLANFKNTLILDNNGNIIINNLEPALRNSVPDNKIRSLSFPQNGNYTKIEIDGEVYFITNITSKESKWSYISVDIFNNVIKNLSIVRIVFIYSILIIFIFGCIIVYHLTRYNYKPIKQLKTIAEKISGISIRNSSDFEIIRGTLDSIPESLEKSASDRFALGQFLLKKLLKGGFDSIEAFNNEAINTSICYHNEYLFTSVILFSDRVIIDIDFVKKLQFNLPKGIEGYFIVTFDENQLIFIGAINNMEISLLTYAKAIHLFLLKDMNINSTIGLSAITREPASLWKSFIEATTAIDYRLIKGKNSVISFSDINIQSDNINIDVYVENKLDILFYFIKQGNYEDISKTILEIVDYLQNVETNIFSVRCVFYDIINTIIKSITDLDIPHEKKLSDYLDIVQLNKIESIGELSETLMSICKNVSIDIIEGKNNIDNKYAVEIFDYIDNNFYKPFFSVSHVAQHFNIQHPALINLFKAKKGITISEYIAKKQIDTAKELLTTTDKKISEIVSSVGHADTSNFIRKFKKSVGFTPNAYRELSQK